MGTVDDGIRIEWERMVDEVFNVLVTVGGNITLYGLAFDM
jgi:hypothetical protein